MTDPRLHPLDDRALADALGGLADAIDWPSATPPFGAGPDLATRVRARLVAAPPRRAPSWRPARRALVLALVGLLALAAAAGAIGLGLPGLRLILAEPSASPPPTPAPSQSAAPGPVGARLGLGTQVALEDLDERAPRPVPRPVDPSVGPPAAAYIDPSRADQVALVWAASDRLPPSLEPGIGMILMAFDGRFSQESYMKIIGSGSVVEPVAVGGHDGYWIEGDPHVFFYEIAPGDFVDDGRRWVGDALIWSDGTTTYRLESALGKAATVAIAESIR